MKERRVPAQRRARRGLVVEHHGDHIHVERNLDRDRQPPKPVAWAAAPPIIDADLADYAATEDDLRIKGCVRLDAQRVASYAIGQGILAPEAVLDHGLVIQDLSRRNLNFRVQFGNGTGLLVKQVGENAKKAQLDALRAEADVLRLIRDSPHFDSLKPFAPRFMHYDEPNGVLATELVHPGTSLTKLHLNGGHPIFPEEAALGVGRILGRFHAQGTQAVRAGAFSDVPKNVHIAAQPFWSLVGSPLDSPHRMFEDAVRGLAASRRGNEIYRKWPTFTEVTHGDIRLDNFLLTSGVGADPDALNLRLIDWELAGPGDSMLDVACLYLDYIRFWSHFAMGTNPRTVEDLRRSPRFRPEAMREMLGLLWQTYAAERQWQPTERRERARRLRDLMPVVLLFGAWEAVANLSRVRAVREAPLAFQLQVALAKEFSANGRDLMEHWFGIAEDGGT